MRSITGVAVSAKFTSSVAQPVPRSVRSITTSNELDSTFTTLAIARIEAVERNTPWIRSLICGLIRNPPSALTVVVIALPSSTSPRKPASSPERRYSAKAFWCGAP